MLSVWSRQTPNGNANPAFFRRSFRAPKPKVKARTARAAKPKAKPPAPKLADAPKPAVPVVDNRPAKPVTVPEKALKPPKVEPKTAALDSVIADMGLGTPKKATAENVSVSTAAKPKVKLPQAPLAKPPKAPKAPSKLNFGYFCGVNDASAVSYALFCM